MSRKSVCDRCGIELNPAWSANRPIIVEFHEQKAGGEEPLLPHADLCYRCYETVREMITASLSKAATA